MSSNREMCVITIYTLQFIFFETLRQKTKKNTIMKFHLENQPYYESYCEDKLNVSYIRFQILSGLNC